MEAFELTLKPAPTAVTAARTAVTERLAARLGRGALEDVRLLVTELITNAVRHGAMRPGDHVSLKASVDERVVRIEVTDPGRDGHVAPRAPGGLGGGYGLFLVEQLAKRWGVERSERTTVWCELTAHGGR